MAEHLPALSDPIFYRTEGGCARIEDRLAFEQYNIFHQQCLKNEARQATLNDNAKLKKYLEGGQ